MCTQTPILVRTGEAIALLGSTRARSYRVFGKYFSSRRRTTLYVYLRQRYLEETQASIQEYIIAGFYIRTLYFVKMKAFLYVSEHGISIVQLAILTATRQFHGSFYILKGKHSNCTHFIL